jgi:tetratricopeptide (TPR) repeat protein
MIPTSYLRGIALSITLVCFSAFAEQTDYGHTTFPNSGTDEAQEAFMQGLLMLHSFEYSDARAAFQQAREIDADFAMAYWGEALTHYRMLWNEIELAEARAVLAELGGTPEERAAKANTQREKDYLAALELLLSGDDDSTRAAQYAEALEKLAGDYPDDENAAAFYALALLGSSGADRDFTIYMKSAAVSEAIMAKNPRHPGAVHYLIHAYDDPVHAPLGLRPALIYAEIAPAATHALHMPSHIFFPLGMWRDASDINKRSYAAGLAWGARNDTPINGGGAHGLSWLVYSLMQEGQYESAREHMRQFEKIMQQDPARMGQFVETWASYLVETDFADAGFAGMTLDPGEMPSRRSSMYHYVKGAMAAKAGDVKTAEAEFASLAALEMKLNYLNWSEKAKDVMLLELRALIQKAQGDGDAAVQSLYEAAEIEYAMPRRFGPPWPPKPSHEMLGELLAERGDHETARQQFRIALSLAAKRSKSLLGLARATAAL